MVDEECPAGIPAEFHGGPAGRDGTQLVRSEFGEHVVESAQAVDQQQPADPGGDESEFDVQQLSAEAVGTTDSQEQPHCGGHEESGGDRHQDQDQPHDHVLAAPRNRVIPKLIQHDPAGTSGRPGQQQPAEQQPG